MTSKSALAAQVIADLRSAGVGAFDSTDEEIRELVECSDIIRRREWIKRNTDQQLWTWRPRAEDAR